MENDAEQDKRVPDCREVFDIVDKDKSGFITRDELAELCSSPTGSYSTSLLDSVMASLDADNDGRISFEEFKTGFNSYRQMDANSDGAVCSTPRLSIQPEEVYESEPIPFDDSWAETSERIDPQGLLIGTGVDNVWRQVCTQEPHLLEDFEKFLSEVVIQLQQSHLEKHTLQQKVKRMLESHSREVHEMDELLEKHLSLAEEDKKNESARKTARLSTHYNSLLEEREAVIEQMTQTESTLKKTLEDKVQNERELTEERDYLLTANEVLRKQLSQSTKDLHSSPTEQQQQLNLASFDGSEDHVKYFPPKKASSHTSDKQVPHSSIDDQHISPVVSMTTTRDDRKWTQGNRKDAENQVSNDASISVSNLLPSNNDPSTNIKHAPLNRIFKVIFLGNSGVGKSSLIFRFCEGKFSSENVPTVGLDFYTKLLTVGDEQVVFQLWDTAGQERFHNALTPVYFKRADAFVIVYDVTDKKSFKSIKSWISIITTSLRQHPPVLMIVGNKSDQSSNARQVTVDDGRTVALEQQALFSEMSALSGDNVLQGHTTLAQLLLARENADLQAFKVHSLKLSNTPTRKCKC